VHRTILVVDVERFGSPTRTDQDRVAVRSGLYRVLTAALAMSSVALADCDHQNCGDGVLVVIPPAVPKSVLVESFPECLIAELGAHNDTSDPARQIRLRMALHAGEVRYDDHGVVGTSINHAFRLLDAAVFKAAFARSVGPLGVIASSWFFEEVVRHSDGGAPAEYRRVQVTAKETDTTAWMCLPGGASAISPVGASAPRQLPPAGRHFVGRTDELGRLGAVLDQHDAPTVVITAIAGTAGIGKTTLATRWANAVRDRFSDGQLHVDLRGFDSRAQLDPAQALHGFLEALDVAPSAIPGDLSARSALYRSLVADRRMLILLDNARSADQVRPLLPNSPTCLVVITSRNRLDSLVVREGAHRIELDVLPFEDAVGVLVCRGSPDRVAAEPEAVARLVELCAGLPLALSIVAARAANQPKLPLGQLAEQLRDERERLDLLDLGERDLDVRAVLSWSYQVLSESAARLFRLLGVHPGPDIDLLACGALNGDGRVGPLLTELTAAHLLEEHQPGRYRFHDLLRVYAKECAERDEPDLDAAKARIADFYVDAVKVADCYLQPCRDGQIRPTPSSATPPHLSGYDDAMAWLVRENATLLAVMDFAARNGLPSHVGRLARALNTFLGRSGQLHERAAVHQLAVDVAVDDVARLVALPSLARALARLGRLDEAELVLDEATELVDHADSIDGAVAVHLGYVLVLELRENYRDALHHALRLWELTRGKTNPQRLADALNAVARQRALLGSAAEALPLGEQALSLYREIGHVEGEAMALSTLGYTHQQLRQYRRAIEAYEVSLAIDRELRSRYWEARILDQVGDVQALLDARDEALAAWREAAEIFDGLHHPEGAAVRAKLDKQNARSAATQ
jgi:tetratricopeptide (TPR) repeat protein